MRMILGDKAKELDYFDNYTDLKDFLVKYHTPPEERFWSSIDHVQYALWFGELPAADREAIWSRFQKFHEKHPDLSLAMDRLTDHCNVRLDAEIGKFDVDALEACFGNNEGTRHFTRIEAFLNPNGNFQQCVDAWRSL